MDYLIPLVEVGILAAVLFNLGARMLPPLRPLLPVVIAGLAIRLGLCILFVALPATRIFHDDADGYEVFGMALARYWTGGGPNLHAGWEVNYGFWYWNGILYWIFGNYRLIPSFMNALLGCLTAITLYGIARRLLVEEVARRALYFALFFPSMILWSSVTVKDTLMVFLLVLGMNSAMRLSQRLSLFHVLVIGGVLSAMLTIRFYMFYMTALAIFLSLTIFSVRRAGRGVMSQLLLAGALTLLVAFLGLQNELQSNLLYFDFSNVSRLRSNLASTSNSGWQGDADVSSPAKAIAFAPLGLLFLLFSPFPWQFTGLRPLLTLPEMLLWWSLTPAWVRGFRYALGSRLSELRPVLVFTVILSLAYSTVHGNVGVAFRQRSQIMIFLFLLAALGLHLKRLRAAGAPDAAVEAEWRRPEPGAAPARGAVAPGARISS
jgi:hypothetical protein